MTQDATRSITSRGKQLLRRFIPKSLLEEREIIQRLGPKAGPIYRRLRLLDMLGLRSSNQQRPPQSARSFVFVCYGNIMRSALAEFLMRQALSQARLTDQVQVVSAGLHATAGQEAHPWAQETAKDLGISLAQHRAKTLSPEMVKQADCVFAMDFQNKAELLTLYPLYQDKICMFSAYADGPRQYREITDPYHGDLQATRICGQQLQTCVRNLMLSLFPGSLPIGASGIPDSRQPGLHSVVNPAKAARPLGPIKRTRKLLS